MRVPPSMLPASTTVAPNSPNARAKARIAPDAIPADLQTTVDVATVKARQLAIVSSKSAYEATQAGYEVGTRNIVDVLNVQQSLFSALRDYANARYDYVVNMLKLKNQAGTLSPEDIDNLNRWLEPPTAPTLSDTELTQ